MSGQSKAEEAHAEAIRILTSMSSTQSSPRPNAAALRTAAAAAARANAGDAAASVPPLAAAYASPPSVSPVISDPPSPPRPTSAELHDSMPILSSSPHDAAPPPAYSPAESHVSPTLTANSATRYHSAPDYNTFAPSRQGAVLQSQRQPQSMGAPNEFEERQRLLDHEGEPLWRKRVRKSRTRRCLKSCLFILLLVAVAGSTTAIALKIGLSSRDNGHSPSSPDQPSPAEPTEPTQPGQPSSPSQPIMPDDPIFEHSYCSRATVHKSGIPDYTLSSGRHQLSISQAYKDEDPDSGNKYVRTAGKIIVRRLSHDDNSAGYISFDVWTTDPGLNVDVQFDQENAMTAYTPQRTHVLNSGQEHHCVSLEMTVWLPYDVAFDEMKIHTSTLAVQVLDDVRVHVRDTTLIETSSGSIKFPFSRNIDPVEGQPPPQEYGIVGRETKLHSDSGKISGTYSLYDLLSITTVSGTVDVSILPQAASEDKPEVPAKLYIASKSGHIKTDLPIHTTSRIPKRDYKTEIKTLSGGIKGSYYLGSETSMTTTSANMDLTLLPGLTDAKTLLFDTTSVSGTIDIEILSLANTKKQLLNRDGDAWLDIGNKDPYRLHPTHPSSASTSSTRKILNNVIATHKSKSGSTNIAYPSEWEGEINIRTYSGRVNVAGDGVRMVRDGKEGWVKRVVKAVKGNEGSHCDVDSISGSVDIRVG